MKKRLEGTQKWPIVIKQEFKSRYTYNKQYAMKNVSVWYFTLVGLYQKSHSFTALTLFISDMSDFRSEYEYVFFCSEHAHLRKFQPPDPMRVLSTKNLYS